MSNQDFNMRLVMQVVGADQAATAIDKTKNSMTKLDTTAATTSTKFQQVGTAFQTAGQKAATAAGMKDRLHSTLQKITGPVTSLGSKFTQLGTNIQQSGQKATAAAGMKDKLTASLQKLTGPIQGIQSKMVSLGTAITTTGSKSQTTATQANSMATAVQSAGTKAAAAGGGFSKVGSAAGSAVTSFGLLTTSSWSLYNAWDRLEVVTLAADKAQARVVTSSKAVPDAQQKITDLTNKLTQMRKDGKQGTVEYTKVERELADATKDLTGKQDKLTIAQENAAIKAGDVKEAYAEFYSQLPLLIASLGSAAAGMLQFGALSKAAGVGATGLTTAAKGLRLALLAIPLVAIAAAILAIRTNAFGVRDALDSLGQRIGQLVPQLQPFLTWLRELGVALGLTGEKLDLSKAFELLKNGMLSVFDTLQNMDWGTLFEKMLDKASVWLSDPNNWKTLGQTLMETFMKAIEWTEDHVYPVLQSWADIAIKWAQNPKNWNDLGKKIAEGVTGAVKWTQENITPKLTELSNFIATAAKDPKNWVKTGEAIMTGISAAIKWTQENVVPSLMPYIGFAAQWAQNPKNWLTVGRDIILGIVNA